MTWWVKSIKKCVGLQIALRIFLFLIFIFAFGICVLISVFALLLGVPVGIASSAVGLKICALISGIIEYKSIIKKTRKKHYKIVFIAKIKLNTIEVLIFKALIDSCVIYDKFVSINYVLR